TFHALREGERPRRPRADLDPAADFLYQLFGYEPDDADRGALDADFILQADRGADASAFAARVVAGTGGDLHAAITAAMAAFDDNAVGAVLEVAREVGDRSRAPAYVRAPRA